MKQFLEEIVKDIFIFIITILTYNTFLILLFPNLTLFNTRFDVIKDFFGRIITGEVFNHPYFLGIFIIFVGIPAIIIMRVSNRLSNKLNFILMPLAIIIFSSLILPFIYFSIFQIELPLIKSLEELLNFYIFTSLVFQIVFGFIIAIWLMITRRKYTSTV